MVSGGHIAFIGVYSRVGSAHDGNGQRMGKYSGASTPVHPFDKGFETKQRESLHRPCYLRRSISAPD
jgi:hypothetical protein